MSTKTTPGGTEIDERRRRIVIASTGLVGFGGVGTGTASARGSGDAKKNGSVPPPVGARVIDTEDPAPDRAVVVLTPDVPIHDWRVFDAETVADHNPTYDPEERVVIVVFERLLADGLRGTAGRTSSTLFDTVCDRGIKFHAFPASRLRRV